MGLPKGLTLNQRDIESWADSLLETLTARERAARKEAEAAAAEREERRLAARQAVQVRFGIAAKYFLGSPGALRCQLAELGRAEWREMVSGGQRWAALVWFGAG